MPEIRRFDGEKIEILRLENEKYAARNSRFLPKATLEALTKFIKESQTLSRLEWIYKIKDWAREVKS